MASDSMASEPSQRTTLMVGPDGHGHWLVQEQGGALEGAFISRDAALQFARWERHAYHDAVVALAAGVLTPRLGGIACPHSNDAAALRRTS